MCDADREAGFSLIEVVAVMLIIALLSGLAVAMMPGTGRAQLKAVALETAALFRRERLGAVLTGSNRVVSLDGERRALSSSMSSGWSSNCQAVRRWCAFIPMEHRTVRC